MSNTISKDIIKQSIKYFYKRAFDDSFKRFFVSFLIKDHSYYRYKLYLHYSKMMYRKNKRLFYKFLYIISTIKYKRISLKINVQINTDYYIQNFYFMHNNVIVNKKSIIGKNATFVGNNCLGLEKNEAPKLGDNVELGYGAIILGGVHIANNVHIGANAIITKDILEEGAVVVGNNRRIK